MSAFLWTPGVGCDVVDVARFQRMLERNPRQLRERLFTRAELRGGRTATLELAACFAVKESLLKAMGIGLWEGLPLTDLAVQGDVAALEVAAGASPISVALGGAPVTGCAARVWLLDGHAHAEVFLNSSRGS